MAIHASHKGLGCVASIVLCYFLFLTDVISLSTISNSKNVAKGAPISIESQSSQVLEDHTCQFCSDSFASRNALFRHLREDSSCSTKLPHDSNQSIIQTTRLSVFFRVAYHCESKEEDESSCEAHWIGEQVQNAVSQSLEELFGDGGSVRSITQTSVARQRHQALSQEEGTSSTGDVLVMSLQVPSSHSGLHENNDFANRLLEMAQLHLAKRTYSNCTIRLLACMPLPSDVVLHAEGDCTQQIYHYLLPLAWLPDGDKLESWCLENNHGSGKHTNPPSDSLRKLREALRRAESSTIPNRRVRRRMNDSHRDSTTTTSQMNSVIVNSKGRSGAFVNKERRPWHNFAHQHLRGDASPNQEPVWRVLDKARISGFLATKQNPPVAILEFRGDHFVQGQIRGIVGTALAITHGWLPSDTFEIALKKDVFLETPVAPSGRLYSAGARFHFHERKLDIERSVLWDVSSSNHKNGKTKIWIQELLLRRRYAAKVEEGKWLGKLQHKVAPRISQAIQVEQNPFSTIQSSYSSLEASIPDLSILGIYNKTLSLLRKVVASGVWPETSIARSKVIRANKKEDEDTGYNGSFTVFNTKLRDNPLVNQQSELPVGNTKFSQLAEAVFELEEALAFKQCSDNSIIDRANIDGYIVESNSLTPQQRPGSLCCAINCNAQFTPHVDSGRGAGQSLSMIVGLGDYTGGELFVERASHDIRYKPLEFDGWSSRHWTNHYSGERFSLVWFSPDVKRLITN